MSFLTTLPAPLSRIDLARLVTNIDGLVRMHGGRSHAAPMDVVHVRSKRPPFTQMSTCVLESPRISRAIVSHVQATPFFAGVSVVVHPKVDGPVLVGDLRVLPTGRTRLYVDVCGRAVAHPSFMKRFHAPLAKVLDGLPAGVKKHPAPAWIAAESGGCGAQLEARAFSGRDLERVFVRYLDAYLIALDQAEPPPEPVGTSALAALFRTHGRAGRYLTRAFGPDFAQKYELLVWRAG